jgi:hypothetical protein
MVVNLLRLHRMERQAPAFQRPHGLIRERIPHVDGAGMTFAGIDRRDVRGQQARKPRAGFDQPAGPPALVGTHYAGSTWESVSGGKQGTSFIQGVNTVGALLPRAPVASRGEEARVPYTAEYFFYRRQ